MIKNRFKSLLSRFQKSNRLSEDNENLCIRLMIDKLEKKSQSNSASDKQIKNEEIQMSDESQSFSCSSA
jgi:hypothetical protein